MCILFYSMESKHFPKDASPEEWQLFTNRIFHSIRNTDNFSVIVFVVCAHIAHTIMCIPCVHLTQIFCGYCMGFLCASTVCGFSEVGIVTAYILIRERRERAKDESLTNLINYIRKNNMLYTFLFASQMSSMSINSTSCIVGSNDVSVREYLASHYVVSAINCCKCCFLGYQIRIATDKSTVIVIGNIIFIISILPTFITCALWYFVLIRFQHQLDIITTDIPKGRDNDTTHDSSVSMRIDGSVFLQNVAGYFVRSLHKYDVMQATVSDSVVGSTQTKMSPEHDVASYEENNLGVVYTHSSAVIRSISPDTRAGDHT